MRFAVAVISFLSVLSAVYALPVAQPNGLVIREADADPQGGQPWKRSAEAQGGQPWKRNAEPQGGQTWRRDGGLVNL